MRSVTPMWLFKSREELQDVKAFKCNACLTASLAPFMTLTFWQFGSCFWKMYISICDRQSSTPTQYLAQLQLLAKCAGSQSLSALSNCLFLFNNSFNSLHWKREDMQKENNWGRQSPGRWYNLSKMRWGRQGFHIGNLKQVKLLHMTAG